MRAFRLTRSAHAATPLDGEGARRAGGRWNPKGIPLVYFASSLSLAVLELLVHVDFNAVPDDLVAIRIEVPDGLPARTMRPEDLPRDWSMESGKPALQGIGAAWFQGAAEPVLQVPSVVVPEEANLLIHPLHPDTGRIVIVSRSPFRLDPRLFKR